MKLILRRKVLKMSRSRRSPIFVILVVISNIIFLGCSNEQRIINQLEGVWALEYNPKDMGGVILLSGMVFYDDGTCSTLDRNNEDVQPLRRYKVIRQNGKHMVQIEGECEFCGDFELNPSELVSKEIRLDTIYLTQDTLKLVLVRF